MHDRNGLPADERLLSLGRSGPGVRSGFLETPRTRFVGVFLASAQTASQFAVSRHAWVASGTAQRLWMSITGTSSIRRLNRVAFVMGRDELGPFGGRAAGGRDGRRLERFAEMRKDLPDRPWLADRMSAAGDSVQTPLACFKAAGDAGASAATLVAACRSRNSNGVSSTTPLAPDRVDFREPPGPTQLAALCRDST
jgi:hypothetical protein